jgi:hypothetical protein
MNGLREIARFNEGPRDAGVRQHRRNTIEWLTRARNALEKGDYEGCAGALKGATKEVDALLPVYARDAA